MIPSLMQPDDGAQRWNLIADKLVEFRHDPLGYALWAFPWGEPGTLLAKYEHPRMWQMQVMADIRDHLQNPETRHQPLQIARASGHGIGKSALFGMLTKWALDTMIDCRANITANTETQLRTKTMPEVQKWHRMAVTESLFKLTATSVYSAATGHEKSWRADFIPWSEHRPEASAGLHNQGNRIFLGMDESSAVADVIWETAEGAQTDADTEIIWVVFGNPTRNKGRFRECFRRYRKYWNTAQIDSRTVEGTNKDYLNRIIEMYGEDSDQAKIRIKGQFPSMSARQLFSTEDVERAFGKHLKEEDYNFAPVIIGVDPAWEGDDETVIMLRQGLYTEVLARHPKNDNDIEVANWIARFEDEYDADAVNIDGGYGTGIVSWGRTNKRSWNLVWFGGKSSRPDCVNKRAEMYLSVRDLLKEGMAIPKEQDLYDEMVSTETLPVNDGKYQLPPKKDFKEEVGRSPDLLDALALTFATPVSTKSQRNYTKAANKARARRNPHDRLKRN